MKTCSRCNHEKPLEQFPEAKTCRDGRRSYCKECQNLYIRERRQNNPEFRVKERQRAIKYRSTEKGKTQRKISEQKRRSLKGNVESNFNEFDWFTALNFFNHECAYCGREAGLEQEHIVPVSNGGTFTIYNIIPACRSCNSSKQDKNLEEWYQEQYFFDEDRLFEIYRYIDQMQAKKNNPEMKELFYWSFDEYQQKAPNILNGSLLIGW